jgi:hypothetical protein
VVEWLFANAHVHALTSPERVAYLNRITPATPPVLSIAMAATNGTLTPPPQVLPPTSPSSAKRKRSDSDNAAVSKGASLSTEKAENRNDRPLQTVLSDIVSVLKR